MECLRTAVQFRPPPPIPGPQGSTKSRNPSSNKGFRLFRWPCFPVITFENRRRQEKTLRWAALSSVDCYCTTDPVEGRGGVTGRCTCCDTCSSGGGDILAASPNMNTIIFSTCAGHGLSSTGSHGNPAIRSWSATARRPCRLLLSIRHNSPSRVHPQAVTEAEIQIQ